MKLRKLMLLALSLGLGFTYSTPAQAVDYGDWYLKGTETLTSFLADANIPTDPMGVWKLVDFRIDKVWVNDEQVSSELISHTRIGDWKKIGDVAEYNEVLLSSPKAYGKESVDYVELNPQGEERETRVSANGAYTYQVQKYRKMREKITTKPYHIVYTFGEQVKHTYTFSAPFEDVNRLTFFNPVTKTSSSVDIKSTVSDTMVTYTAFTDNGKRRVVHLDDKDIDKDVIPGDGYEAGQEIPGSRISNTGKTRAAMNVGSKAFASNSQIGTGAGKVSYSGAKERLATGVDKVAPTEVRDPSDVVTSSLLAESEAQVEAAKNPANFDSVAQLLADLKARAAKSNLKAEQAAKIATAIDAVNKQIASTKAEIAARKAAEEAAKKNDQQAKKAAEEARKAAEQLQKAADQAQQAAEKAAKEAADKLAKQAQEVRKAQEKAAEAAAKKAADEAAAKKHADELAAKQAAEKLAAANSIDKLFLSPAYNKNNVGATMKGYIDWLNGDNVDNYRDVVLAMISARNDDERKAMIQVSKAKKLYGAAFFSDAQLKGLINVANSIKGSPNMNAIINLITSNGKTLDKGNGAWVNQSLNNRIAAMNSLINQGKLSKDELSALNTLKKMFPESYQLKDLAVGNRERKHQGFFRRLFH